MSDKFDLNAVQSALGYYFKDSDVIKTAFTHESAVSNGTESNVKLVFLGQRLLDLMITDHICRDGVSLDTKNLNKRLEVCRDALEYEKYVSAHGLAGSIIFSAHAEALRNSPPIHAQIFLALLAAIYRDGGLPSVKSFILPMIRQADGSAKYSPKPLTAVTESEPMPKVKPQKTEEKPKKSLITPVVKLFSKTKKAEKKEEPKPVAPAPEPKPEKTEKKEPEQKRFIRDALQPVSLPESMKTKPKKEKKSALESKPEVKPSEEKTAEPVDNNNYKSMLQELIQKATHSACVLLKYTTTSPSKGKVVTEITLDDSKLSEGEAANKKLSEREAAKSAYLALTNKKTKLYKWFVSLNGGETVQQSAPVKEDFVSKLNRHYQKLSHASSAPLTYEKRPSEKKSNFSIAVIANGEEIAVGSGKSLKEAKQSAAASACAKLGI